MAKRREVTVTEEHFEKARQLADELRKKLPSEFVLKARWSSNGHFLFQDLHFKADPKIPGRFSAHVDRDRLMGRKTEPSQVKVKPAPHP